jgi:hypothetical protein
LAASGRKPKDARGGDEVESGLSSACTNARSLAVGTGRSQDDYGYRSLSVHVILVIEASVISLKR